MSDFFEVPSVADEAFEEVLQEAVEEVKEEEAPKAEKKKAAKKEVKVEEAVAPSADVYTGNRFKNKRREQGRHS